MGSVLEEAVTWLFVPGDRPDRFAKAAAAGADVVIVDLEDAVAAGAKADARANAVAAIRDGIGAPFLVRVDASGPADLAALAGIPPAERDAGFLGVVWPKAEDPAALAAADGLRVVALVESAVGVHRAPELAAHPSVVRLAVGAIDLAADLGLRDDRSGGAVVSAVDGPVIEHCKARVVIASRLAGLPAPVDSPSVELRDHVVTTATTLRGAALGFGGRLCIHPAQVEVVALAFAPTFDEVEHAERVLAAAAGGGAVAVDGRMVDEPVLVRARQVLAAAAAAEARA